MNDSGVGMQNQELMHKATEVSIRLFLVAALGLWCFLIFQPFLMPLLFLFYQNITNNRIIM